MSDRKGTNGGIAVSGAAPKISLSLGTSRTATTKTATNTKRPHALLHDDDNEDEGPKQEAISDFGSFSKADDTKDGPARIIKSLPNRDWQEDMRRKRQKSGIPQRGGPEENDNKAPDTVEASKTYGLTFRNRSQSPSETPQEPEPSANNGATSHKTRTVDEEALDALTGKERTQDTIIRPQSPQNEEEAFRAQYAEAPEVATLEDYAATPVEGFGAAILRGYLAPGETLESRMEKGGSKDRKIERRPGLLGIGAKDSGLGVELGAWGGTKRGKKGKDEINYNPLARKNVKTGEMLTEDELRKKLEEQDLTSKSSSYGENKDYEDRRVQRHADSSRSNGQETSRRDREEDRRERNGYSRTNGREDDRYEHRSSHRERSTSRDRHYRRDRDRYYDKDRRDKDRSRRSREDDHHSSRRSRHEHRRRDRSR